LQSTGIFHVLVKSNYYRDSLNLLKISDIMKRHSSGIMEAVVIMGTKTNKAVLVKLGFPSSKINQATESDLIVAIKAEDKGSIDSALIKLEELLHSDGSSDTSTSFSANSTDLDSVLVSKNLYHKWKGDRIFKCFAPRPCRNNCGSRNWSSRGF